MYKMLSYPTISDEAKNGGAHTNETEERGEGGGATRRRGCVRFEFKTKRLFPFLKRVRVTGLTREKGEEYR